MPITCCSKDIDSDTWELMQTVTASAGFWSDPGTLRHVYIPVDTRRNNNVIITPKRCRFDVIMTLLRHVSVGMAQWRGGPLTWTTPLTLATLHVKWRTLHLERTHSWPLVLPLGYDQRRSTAVFTRHVFSLESHVVTGKLFSFMCSSSAFLTRPCWQQRNISSSTSLASGPMLCAEVASSAASVRLMMTSSNGNIFRVGALMFSLIYAWINGWVNNREAGDLIRYRAH